MTDIRKRFDHATDLRTFAAEVERLELASRRDPESPVLAKVALAQRMRRQADAVMRAADAVERGRITADTLFRPTGRVVKVDVRRARVRPTGTIKVAA